jgi:hypothetical protein
MPEPGRAADDAAPRLFVTTHWSAVLAAGGDDSAPAKVALETLCGAYWYPIYVFVRRKGHGPDDAQDLTQEFFYHLIRKQDVRLADRTKGKFRTFLLAMLDSFLAREWSRAHRQKRGGLAGAGKAGGALSARSARQRHTGKKVPAPSCAMGMCSCSKSAFSHTDLLSRGGSMPRPKLHSCGQHWSNQSSVKTDTDFG